MNGHPKPSKASRRMLAAALIRPRPHAYAYSPDIKKGTP